jgi:hypothetical protein
MPTNREVPRRAGLALVVIACLLALVSAGDGRPAGHAAACSLPRFDQRQSARIATALRSRRDILGERLLARRDGPTYDTARRALPPLFLAAARGGRLLTRSGAYYLAFGMPLSLYGEKAFALHVADGSEILTRSSRGRSLRLLVGDGSEPYGSCTGRLGAAKLAAGFLPILQTTYTDANGAHYRQESFTGRVTGVRSLVSFVRLEVDARSSSTARALVRFVPSAGAAAVRSGRSAFPLAYGSGGKRVGNVAVYDVRDRAVIHVAWAQRPPRVAFTADDISYRAARDDVERFWKGALAEGATFDVPERRVRDAERNLLIQQLTLTWRYSIGNPYEELSFAEALDAARVMAGFGHAEVSQAIIRFAGRRLPARFSNWRAGALLLAAADQTRLFRDRAFLEAETPVLRWALTQLERQLRHTGPNGLLDREPFSSDIPRRVVSLHGQAVAWQGLSAIGRAWSRLGYPVLAARAADAALRLERGLRPAIRSSEQSLADGSLFVPASLFERIGPFDRLTDSRDGSYWNLVAPYALASGLFPPGGPEARGLWRYLQLHGSRLLGLVRSGAYRLDGRSASSSGIDQVYGLNLARFLADLDLPDELVLSLYGTLAGALTPGTYVGGEAATVAPVDGRRDRTMYLPPNGGTNTAFLENLRVALVHERRGPRGAPKGLDLAFATPRAWLGDGKSIRVRDAPTSFGPVSYTIRRRGSSVRVTLDAPPTPSLRMRLRLPTSARIVDPRLDGRRARFDPGSGTIELPSDGRPLRLVAGVVPGTG